MVRPPSLATGLFFATCLSLPAQGSGNSGDAPTQQDKRLTQPSSTLLIRLRSTSINPIEAKDIAAILVTRKVTDRLLASKILRTHYLKQTEEFEKALTKCIAMVGKAATKAQRRRLGRNGAAEVAELRKRSLAVSRQSGLTKAQIKGTVDPIVKELRSMLRPQLADVLQESPKVDLAILELRMHHTERLSWFATYASMTEGLELHRDTARHFAKYPAPQPPGEESRVDEAVEAAIFAGLPMSASDQKVLERNAAAIGELPREEYLGTLKLNQIRYLLGLNLLRIDPKLADASRDHSKDMHTLGFFSHTSPVEGKQSFGQRAANFGTSAGAENIAAGQRTGASAIQAWWYSPGHHRNMLGGHRRTGLGQHETMWTQMFGG